MARTESARVWWEECIVETHATGKHGYDGFLP